MSFGQATVDATRLAMHADDRVIVLGEDISWGGNFGQFRGLLDEFGPEPDHRHAHLGGAHHVGRRRAAMCGLRPVASMSFVEFTLGAMDEIVNQAAKMRYMSGGQVSACRSGAAGLRRRAAVVGRPSTPPAWRGCSPTSPGLKVVAPSNPADAKGLLRSAMDDDDPVIYLENKSITAKRGPVPEGDHRVPLGAATVVREGTDVTLITYSAMTLRGIDAAATLAEIHGISAELIDLRSLWPLDFETVAASVSKTGRIVIAHEAWLTGGYGAELSARIGEDLFADLKAPVVRVGAARAPIPFSPPLESAVVPGADAIVEAAVRIVS